MERIQIENMDDWLVWKRRIIEGGFTLWQTQYGWDLPEGLIVRFMDPSDQRFEIITHSEEVSEDIDKSGLSGI